MINFFFITMRVAISLSLEDKVNMWVLYNNIRLGCQHSKWPPDSHFVVRSNGICTTTDPTTYISNLKKIPSVLSEE